MTCDKLQIGKTLSNNRKINMYDNSLRSKINILKLRIFPFDAILQKAKPKEDLSLIPLFSETGYCFIHIPKNGGSSVEKIIYKNHLIKHRKWHEFYAMSPTQYEKWIKFCVIRNPIDRFLSSYDYLKNAGRNPVDAEIGRRFVKPTKDVNEFIHKFSYAPYRRAHYVLLPFSNTSGICTIS